MPVDLAIILDDWPFDEKEEANNIRKIVGMDGQLKLQLRLRDGVIQWALEGRPDGSRPCGYESVLAYARFLVAGHGGGSDESPFRLGQNLLDELEEELVDYSRRLAALLRIGDYEHARRDSTHALDVLATVRQYADDVAVALECDRYRPQLISDRAKAESLLEGRRERWEEAVHALNRGMAEIRDYFSEHSNIEEVAGNPQHQRLVEMRRSLRERYNIPLTDYEQLHSLEAEQQVAIKKEDFQMAARLRDKIRLLRDRLGPAG